MDESDGLENRCASHFCHQRLGPMKEAALNEGASLVSETPPSGSHRGRVLVTVGCARKSNRNGGITCLEVQPISHGFV